MSSFKPRLLLIPLVVWAASIGCAEVAFRLLGQQPTTELAGLYEQFGVTYKLRPNVQTDADWASGRFSVTTDLEGLRCGRHDAARPATSSNDVIVIGDSQAYGQGLSYEDTLVGRLASAAGTTATIRNAAVGGHYLEDQFKLVHWLYDRGMRPKAVVVFITPYLIATAGHENHAKVGDDGRLYSDQFMWYHGLTIWLKMHTVTYGMIRNALRTFVPDETPAAVGFFAANNEAGYEARLIKSFGGFHEWANARGIVVFMVYTPLAMELDFAPVARAAEAAHVSVDPNMPVRIAHGVATALGVGFYDLRPTLAGLNAAHRPLTLYKDPHYNATTSRACGEEVWRAIQSDRILHPASNSLTVEKHGTGDSESALAKVNSRESRGSQ